MFMSQEAKKQQQLQSIRKHNSACANPTGFVSDLQDVVQKKWNKDKDGQVCASVIVDNKRQMLSYDGEKFTTVDISDVPDRDLVNSTSQEQTFDRVQAKLKVFKNIFKDGKFKMKTFQKFDPDLYKLNFVRQGEQVVVPAEPGTMIACILAHMHPTYYDFNVYDHTQCTNVNYDTEYNRNLFEHSGDIEQENILLHFTKLAKNEIPENGHKMALFITGFRDTPLERFHSQSPANLLFDHKKKIIHIIEFPLDKATVGDATLGIPGVGEIRNGNLFFDVFTKPETGDGSAPDYKEDTMDLLISAVQRFSSCENETPMDAFDSTSHSVKKRKHEEGIKRSDPHILQIEVGKVTELGIGASHLIKNTGGVSCYLNGELDKRVHTVPPLDLGQIVLPGLLGPIEGPFICLASHPIEGFGTSPHCLEYFRNCFPILTVSTAMTDTARQTAGNNRINGLFIIEPEGPVDTLDKLASVNKNAVTALAGPLSLVLVKHGATFRFLEGIALKGLMNEVPEFGDIVHLEMENIKKWALQNCIDEPIVDITQCKPTLGENSFTLPEIISFIETLSIDKILGMKQSILCLYYQLTRIYGDEELQQFAKQLFDVLDKVLMEPPKHTEDLKKLQEQFEKGETKMRMSPMYEKTKQEYAKKKKQLRFLMDKVSSLMSEKNTSSKSMTHKQLKRFNAIKGNADRVKNMKSDDFEGIIALSCSDMGVLVCAGEPSDLKNFIDIIGKNKMKERLISDTKHRSLKTCQDQITTIGTNSPFVQLSFRQQMIDALTATCLLQLTSGTGPLHSQDNSFTLSIPESSAGSRGAVLIPLLDMFVQMSNPYYGDWINLCNDPDVAMFRLLMRSTFIKASIGRDLPQRITANSNDLSWGMVNIYLDLMHQLSSHRTTPMSVDNFDETLCQQIRCLFGLILTQLAAGQDPISLIWQLWRGEKCRPELPMYSWQWPLYLEMAYLMQFTGWPQTGFRRNLKILLIRAMNSKIAYPMCEFLRDEKVRIKKEKYGLEYEKKLKKIYYPAKKSLTKKVLKILETGEIPSKEFLTEYENIFNQFPNKRVMKGGIKTILIEIGLMIKYGNNYKEDSKKYLLDHCGSTLQKHEPRLKICRLNLKRTQMKAVAENQAPGKEDIEKLTKQMEEVSSTFEKEKNVSFAKAYEEMKYLLQFLAHCSSSSEKAEDKSFRAPERRLTGELVQKMYQGLKYDCWNLEGIAHDEKIEIGNCNLEEEDNNTNEEINDVVKKIFEHKKNSENKDVKAMVDTERPALERITALSKLIQIEEATVLIKMARLAGFGNTDEKVMENLFLALHELFYCWETDPDVLEKLVADKIENN